MKIFPDHVRITQHVKIINSIYESKHVKTLFFKFDRIAKIAKPGQFLMVCVFDNMHDGHKEIPLSISYIDMNSGILGISIKAIGQATVALHSHKINDSIGIRGPYGNGFNLTGTNVAVVGGGIGMAPLMPLVREYSAKHIKLDVFIGAVSKDYLCFIDGVDVVPYIATNDGTMGHKGLITDLLEKKVMVNKYDHIATVGPEPMMKKILNICNIHNISMQAGTERLIKCARGLCGECCIDNVRVCTDGPIFDKTTLNNLKEWS